MKPDTHGIWFNIWIYFILFAAGVVLLLGVLQFSLITPYYRDAKISTIRQIADQVQTYIIDQNGSESAAGEAFHSIIENNVCVSVYNTYGQKVYSADSLGSGCVFNAGSANDAGLQLYSGVVLKQLVNDSNGEYSLNLKNSRTNQDMMVYGRRISMNLTNLYVFVNSPLEPVDSIIKFFSRQYLSYTAVILVLASIISIFIARTLTRPVTDMTSEAKKLAEADYSAHFEGGRFTETKDLAATLNGATKKLAGIDELRKDLIANVSHDIRTPLTSIRAYAEMIRDISGDNPKKRTKHLNVIISEADYLDHLVTDMRELSKIQSGNYVPNYENFDLSQVIREVTEISDVQLKEGKLQVVTQIPKSLIAYGDRTKLKEVIYNFFSNAIKHSPQGSTIWIRAEKMEEEGSVRVEVEDHGEGIAKEEIGSIWDRYQKSSSSFSRSMTSTGLGLAIVKAILEAHHAKYGVQSQVGKGSLFWFEISAPTELADTVEEIDEE